MKNDEDGFTTVKAWMNPTMEATITMIPVTRKQLRSLRQVVTGDTIQVDGKPMKVKIAIQTIYRKKKMRLDRFDFKVQG
jgi:hypothetical protein